MASGLERGFGFDLCKIEGLGARPDIVAELHRSRPGAFAVEDAQLPAAQVASGRASGADRNSKRSPAHGRGRHIPDVQLSLMRLDDKRGLGRGQLLHRRVLQVAVLVRRDNDGAIDVLSDGLWRCHDDAAGLVAFVLRCLEFGASQFGTVVISYRDARPLQVMARTFDADRQRDFSAGVNFVG